MTEKKEFITLQDVSEAYETKKRGKEFRARITSFAGKDAQVREIEGAGRYVVSTFINLKNSAKIVNEKLGTDFIEDEKYQTIVSNFSYFVETKEEAETIAKRIQKGSQINAPVVFNSHTYNDKLFLDARVDTLFVQEPKESSIPLNKRVSDAAKDLDDTILL